MTPQDSWQWWTMSWPRDSLSMVLLPHHRPNPSLSQHWHPISTNTYHLLPKGDEQNFRIHVKLTRHMLWAHQNNFSNLFYFIQVHQVHIAGISEPWKKCFIEVYYIFWKVQRSCMHSSKTFKQKNITMWLITQIRKKTLVSSLEASLCLHQWPPSQRSPMSWFL